MNGPNDVDVDRMAARSGASVTDLNEFRNRAANAARTGITPQQSRFPWIVVIAALAILVLFGVLKA